MGCAMYIWWHLNWIHLLECWPAIVAPISSSTATFYTRSLLMWDWNGSKLGQVDMSRSMNAIMMEPMMHVCEKLLLIESGRALVESAVRSEPKGALLIVASILDADSLTLMTCAPLKLTV